MLSSPSYSQDPSEFFFSHLPLTFCKNPICTPAKRFYISIKTTHVSALNKSTAYTTALQNAADVRWSTPYHLKMPPILPQSCRAFPKLILTAGQSLSD